MKSPVVVNPQKSMSLYNRRGRVAFIAGCILWACVGLQAQNSGAGATFFIPALRSGAALHLGVTLANPTTAPVTVTWTARGYDGQLIGGEGIRNPAELTLAAHSRLARLSTEIFGAGIAGRDGWIELTTPEPAVDGFFLLFDGGPRAIDGGTLVQEKSARLLFPEVNGDALVHFVNAGARPQTLPRLRVYDNAGRLVGERFLDLEANGGWSGTIGDLVPEARAVKGWALLERPFGGDRAETLLGMVSYRRNGGDVGVVMARPVTAAMRTGSVAHVATASRAA